MAGGCGHTVTTLNYSPNKGQKAAPGDAPAAAPLRPHGRSPFASRHSGVLARPPLLGHGLQSRGKSMAPHRLNKLGHESYWGGPIPGCPFQFQHPADCTLPHPLMDRATSPPKRWPMGARGRGRG